jgi:hypothetical protein
LASFVRRVAHDPMDTASFFFSFESDLPETAPEALIWGGSGSGDQISPNNACGPRLYCAK